jgi:hypothetical protein
MGGSVIDELTVEDAGRVFTGAAKHLPIRHELA